MIFFAQITKFISNLPVTSIHSGSTCTTFHTFPLADFPPLRAAFRLLNTVTNCSHSCSLLNSLPLHLPLPLPHTAATAHRRCRSPPLPSPAVAESSPPVQCITAHCAGAGVDWCSARSGSAAGPLPTTPSDVMTSARPAAADTLSGRPDRRWRRPTNDDQTNEDHMNDDQTVGDYLIKLFTPSMQMLT